MPIKISGPIIETHMAYFITNDTTPKGKDPNINVISSIHKIKDKTSVSVLVSNYTNKHLMFHKGEYIGHLEPPVMDNNTKEQTETHQTNSITLKENDLRQSHLKPLIHHAMDYLQLSKMNLNCYYRNMNLNLQRMKLQL